ncbi:hypothetical protein [Pseudooceanicola marinus]|uniref:hypothetical protein n=1 Tax=Pseudooceanicola marinus TaxID=396013 RepID=UPI001CD7D054|nr:hypothetical protein [Pseudooceanicola marinus]MCA1334359.1 hypothetical protein [Pseudooceanicola marinus]
MTLQNRVDPFGTIRAVPARGQLMGNRGILHDDRRVVRRTHAHQAWVACALSYKGRDRKPLMWPGRYTELFFLDEATALASGHRPCATCRRDRFKAFTAAWKAVHGGPEEGRSLPQTIDRALHRARIARGGRKVTSEARAADLPDGTIIARGEDAFLILKGSLHLWGFEGYGEALPLGEGPVTVLTPAPLLKVLRHGYRPEVHPSLTGDNV